MKTIMLVLLAVLTAGCVPSLCLFNCGDTVHKDGCAKDSEKTYSHKAEPLYQ